MQRRRNVQPDAKQHGQRNAAGPTRSIGNFRKKVLRGGGLWGRNGGKLSNCASVWVWHTFRRTCTRCRRKNIRTHAHTQAGGKLGVLVCVAPTSRTRHNVLSSHCSYSSFFSFLSSSSSRLLFAAPQNTQPLKMAAIKLPAGKIAFSWKSIGAQTCHLLNGLHSCRSRICFSFGSQDHSQASIKDHNPLFISAIEGYLKLKLISFHLNFTLFYGCLWDTCLIFVCLS